MKKIKKNILLSLASVGIIIVSYSFSTPGNKKINEEPTTGMELKTNMRKLWEDHVMWTRNVIFNIIDDLPGKDEAVIRLFKNQEDIGDAIKPYYGADAGKKLTELLHSHIAISADLLYAKKVNDDKAFKEANDKWYVNADEISEFLSKANSFWKLADMKKMMHDHLKFTTDEGVARYDKNYDADVKAYDKVHDEILEMSDMLSNGIMQQFPDKFKSSNTLGKK